MIVLYKYLTDIAFIENCQFNFLNICIYLVINSIPKYNVMQILVGMVSGGKKMKKW